MPQKKTSSSFSPDPKEIAAVWEEIAKHSPDVLFKIDLYPKAKLTYISDSCEKSLGHKKAELLKKPELLLKHIQSTGNKFVGGKKFSGNGSPNGDVREHLQVHTPKGETRFLELSCKPILNSKKELMGLVGSLRDISDHLLTDELMVDVKSKFDLITTVGNDIITFFTYLPKEKYIYVSPNIEKILGFKPEELLKDHNFFSRRLLSERDVFDAGDKALFAAQRKGEPCNYKLTYQITNSRGKKVWIENSSVPIKNTRGKIGFYLNILKDVTEERIREEEIQKQYVSYRELLEHSPAAYLIHDKGLIVYCNPQAQDLFKASKPEKLQGRKLDRLFVEEKPERLKRMLLEVYEHKGLNAPYKFRAKDLEGKTIEVEIKSVFIKYQNKDMVLSRFDNISEAKVRERQKQ